MADTITNTTRDQLVHILEAKPDYLTKFEIDLVNDTLERHKQYGSNTRLTAKAAKVIDDIFLKVYTHGLEPLQIKEEKK